MDRILAEKFVTQQQAGRPNIFVYLVEGKYGQELLDEKRKIVLSHGIKPKDD